MNRIADTGEDSALAYSLDSNLLACLPALNLSRSKFPQDSAGWSGDEGAKKTLVAPRELDCDGGVAGAPVPSFPLIIAHSIVRNSHSAAAVGRGLSHLASLRMRYGGGGPLFTLGALTRKLPRGRQSV